jgi:hypothetical protein
MSSVKWTTNDLKRGDKVLLAAPEAEAIDLKRSRSGAIKLTGTVLEIVSPSENRYEVSIEDETGQKHHFVCDRFGQCLKPYLQLFKVGRIPHHHRAVQRVHFDPKQAQFVTGRAQAAVQA